MLYFIVIFRQRYYMRSLKSFLIILSFSSCCFNTVYSQDTNIVKFFPLAVGNKWVYAGSASIFQQCNRTFRHRLYIDSIKSINNKFYYKINFESKHISGTGSCGISYIYTGFYRVDSVSGIIYKSTNTSNCFSNTEMLFDSLKSKLGDTARSCTSGNNYKKLLVDTFMTTVFGNQIRSKNFQGGNFFEYGYTGRYAKDFGLVEYREFGMSVSTNANLIGCVLNGVLYGDTSFYFVGITPISNTIPKSFELFQNYPNPFNPSTQIKFDIPKSSFVRITVYDALGRQAAELVNQELNAGSYSYDWDASNYPSGVYYYKIVAGDYTQTRKMVLIK
jgi:hypothetical protein